MLNQPSHGLYHRSALVIFSLVTVAVFGYSPLSERHFISGKSEFEPRGINVDASPEAFSILAMLLLSHDVLGRISPGITHHSSLE